MDRVISGISEIGEVDSEGQDLDYGKTTPDGIGVSFDVSSFQVESGQDDYPLADIVSSVQTEWTFELLFAGLETFERALGLPDGTLTGHLEPAFDDDSSTLDDDGAVDEVSVGADAVAGTYNVSAPGDGSVTLDDGAGNAQTLSGLADGAQTLDFDELDIEVVVDATFAANSGAAESYDGTTATVEGPQDEVIEVHTNTIGTRSARSYYVKSPGPGVGPRRWDITRARIYINGEISLSRDQEVRVPVRLVTLVPDTDGDPIAQVTDPAA